MQKKDAKSNDLASQSGLDETRTRDPMRDRHVVLLFGFHMGMY